MTSFAGTWTLVRLVLRRDRVIMGVWVLVLAALPVTSARATAALYPTDRARQGYIDDLGGSSFFVLFYGPEPPPGLGSLVFWRFATGMVVLAVVGVLVAVRHTRGEEEAGRRELVRSGAVGRYADVAAAVVATGGASLAVGLLVALGMTGQHTPVAGAFAMGLAWASSGIMFAAVGAVAAQLTRRAGTARALGLGVVAGSFVLRAAGDVAVQGGSEPAWLSWTPPLGLAYQVRAYELDRWWSLGLAAALAAGLTGLALALSARRDLWAGLLASRPGPARGAPGLRTPLALAWRLHRPALAGWSAGLVVYGVVVAAVARTAGDLVADNPQLEDALRRLGGPARPADLFLASTLTLAGLLVAGYAVAAALRLRAEETGQLLEPLLASPVPRTAWTAGHLTFALLGPAVALAAGGLAAGLVRGLDTGDVGYELPRVLSGALVQLPAVWVLAALTVTVYGAWPRAAAAAGWTALAVCVLLGQVGALLGLGSWALDLSPFTHVPHVPGGPVTATPLVVMTMAAAALAAAGVLAFRRRDVPAT